MARGRGFLIMLLSFFGYPYIYTFYLRWECDQVVRSFGFLVCVPRSSGSSFFYLPFLFCLGSGARRAVPTALYFAPGYQPFGGAVGPRVGSLRSDRGSVAKLPFCTDCVDDD